jgi:hypothetical protein
MKLKILMIPPQIILEICKYGNEKARVIKDAIPQDAKYIRSFTNDVTGNGMIGLVIESESFIDVTNG